MNCNSCSQLITHQRDMVDVEFSIDPGVRYHFHPACISKIIVKYPEMVEAIYYDSFLEKRIENREYEK